MRRGRCQRCMFAGELVGVSYGDGYRVIRKRLCIHCAVHDDTPAIGCDQCFPQRLPKTATAADEGDR